MMRANIDVMHNPCMATKEIGGMGDDELCAVGLSEWAYVHTGSVHPNFGEVMTAIALKLGITGTNESFMEYADQLLEKRDGRCAK